MNASNTDQQLDRGTAATWSSWFASLADPARVLILHLLATAREPLTVGEITDQLDVGQSTVSHHLAKLAAVGFVLVDRVGTSSLWRINGACIDVFPSAVDVIMGRADLPDHTLVASPTNPQRSTRSSR